MGSKPHTARDGLVSQPADPAPPPPPAPPVPYVREQHGMLVVPADTDVLDCPTSLDVGTEAGRCALLNAMNAPDLVLGGDGRCDALIEHWLAHPASRADRETGEIVTFSRLVLIGQDGRCFATSSPYVAHQLARLLRLFGVGKISPPLPCTIRQRVSRSTGRTYHELTVYPREGV